MNSQDQKYQRAKKRIADEKGFYSHLFVYVVINILLQLFYAGFFIDKGFFGDMPWWVQFTTPFFWGLSLLFHWFWVFKNFKFFGYIKTWEERKIKQFMEEEEKIYNTKFTKDN
ncbi:2TM domain-containing protein [Dokdonia sp. Hel_I_53]|uniref:2TM domain-containing protein n=1 Tax=Dokdonia sp. Hel_I_53 TaxID=1566287 RepID=UPI00119AC74D|nr:2TM domain-containing protein [Dokdonia sp. Hel_I_53]TVZ51138.1 2TM domain-containing protein [Dokdonia sp. Hel_I_53]